MPFFYNLAEKRYRFIASSMRALIVISCAAFFSQLPPKIFVSASILQKASAAKGGSQTRFCFGKIKKNWVYGVSGGIALA
jgi:hypothetical protein